MSNIYWNWKQENGRTLKHGWKNAVKRKIGSKFKIIDIEIEANKKNTTNIAYHSTQDCMTLINNCKLGPHNNSK